MDQAEFRLRFNLHPLAKQDPAALPHQGLRKAAVLIPLQEIRGELNLILTQRPMHLRAHPGQISFPGGKIEPSDPSAIMAALREAEEEIGLCRENVDVIGNYPSGRDHQARFYLKTRSRRGCRLFYRAFKFFYRTKPSAS